MIRAANCDVDTPHGLPPRLRFEFFAADTGLPLDMTGRTAELEIYENSMVSLFATDSGTGGAIAISGNAVDVVISAEFEDYYDNIKEWPQKQYRWRMDIDDDFRLQGVWRSLIRAGRVTDTPDTARVEVSEVIVQVQVASVTPSRPADLIRIMNASGDITLLDNTVLIRAGAGAVAAAMPAPASAFGAGAGLLIVVVRAADDDPAGSVEITGTGPELPEVLYPGESLWLQSDGSSWHVIA